MRLKRTRLDYRGWEPSRRCIHVRSIPGCADVPVIVGVVCALKQLVVFNATSPIRYSYLFRCNLCCPRSLVSLLSGIYGIEKIITEENKIHHSVDYKLKVPILRQHRPIPPNGHQVPHCLILRFLLGNIHI